MRGRIYMFKRGVITDEISQQFEEAVELAGRYKLDGVEIRSVWEKGPHELDKTDIKKMKEILSSTNLQVCGISAPFFKCDIDDEKEIKNQIELLKRAIDLGQSLGTNFVRGFTFWAKGGFDENLNKIVSKFEEPLKLLEREKATLVLEFDPSVFASNAKKLVKVIEKIDSKYVKGLWDPGNDIYDPDNEVPFPEGYDYIKKHMVHMHLKDAIKMPDGKIMGAPIGDGQVDYAGHFKQLIEDNYEGFVVLETHYRPKHDIGEELLALPKGSAFSYLGYEATEECLIKWNSLMKNIL
jgi:L-ribulose-5-phosphate 3-epimerase